MRELSAIFSLLLIFLLVGEEFGFGSNKQGHMPIQTLRRIEIKYENTLLGVAYTGSQACQTCHQAIYQEYFQTPMGRSMSGAEQSLEIGSIPVPAVVFDPKANQYIRIFRKDPSLYMEIYGLSAKGKIEFAHTEKLVYAIGSGLNAVGYIIRRGNYLFQAPLAFYTRNHKWDLAPGYERIDLGFSRPVTTTCIGCHSGLPRPVRNNMTGLYENPPFQEAIIGCERCHGPGALHVKARVRGEPLSGDIDKTIVNPTDLPVWLANDICMSCHQGEDAWVLKKGKDYTDFRPGTPLDDTFAIFAVPPQQKPAGSLPLLDHYFQMTLSECFRDSGGRMSCLTCHDPHVWPTVAQAPGYYRQKCLTCHTNQSCGVPLKRRLEDQPPNNCIGCHMPKLHAQAVAHTDITNHRIIASRGEPYPSNLPTAGSSGLIYLDAPPGSERAPVLPLVLLQAYTQVLSEGVKKQYQVRFSALLDQLATSEGNSVFVLRALAERAAARRTTEGNQQAIHFLERALEAGSKQPEDRLLLGVLLLREGRYPEVVRDASALLASDPYNLLCYLLAANAYLAEGKRDEAHKMISKGLYIYPENPSLQKLSNVLGNGQLRLEEVH